MNIAIISFTQNGFLLSAKIAGVLEKEMGCCVKQYVKGNYLEKSGGILVDVSLATWTEKMFETQEGIIFIGASGIAVRGIAPWVQDKRYDPAVLVLDEKGEFCIPLLSGHLGGANELAMLLSKQLGARAVITTATDVNARFAVDVFAKENGLVISDMRMAKEVSAKLLHGENVGVYSELEVLGELPEGLLNCAKMLNKAEVVPDLGIHIGVHKDRSPFQRTLYLIPDQIVLGIGCRKGTDKDTIAALIIEVLSEKKLFVEGIQCVCSIDLKKDELGILQYCKEYKLDFVTYSSEELSQIPGEYTASAFVNSVTGVDNVCERSASLGSGFGNLIVKKRVKNGVTVALAIADRSVHFE